MSFLGSIVHLMAGSGLQEHIQIIFAVKAVRYMLTDNAISLAVRHHMLIDAALNTILVAKAYHIPLPSKATDEPKRDTASTEPGIGDEEIRSAGQQHDIADVASVITEAKEVYDKKMLPTFSVDEVCSAGVLEKENREEIG